MSGLGIIGPEFIFQLALGQWSSARRSVEQFKQSGYPQWTIKHAFLADMGGFVLHAPDWVEFIVDARQVHYLVTRGYVSFEQVAVDGLVIEDKNKGAGLVRLIVVCQMLWFTLDCCSRAIQHLAVTTLELTTLGFIFCTLGTYFAWVNKPQDVLSPIVLIPNTTLADILIRAGNVAKDPYKSTPLDFVNRNQWSSWNLYWRYGMNILRKFNIVFATKKRPIDKLPDDNFTPLSLTALAALFFFQIGYGAIHVVGWNFHFATATERLLWRISTIVMLSSIVLYWIFDIYTWYIHPLIRKTLHRISPLSAAESGVKVCAENCVHPIPQHCRKPPGIADKLRNNSPQHDPGLSVPLKAILPIGVVAAVYVFARGFIILEDFLSLRSQPPNAYESVNWLAFWPHF